VEQVYQGIENMADKINQEKDKITTIKLSKKTKDRLDKLKVYKRESYEEIIQKMLEILNLVRTNPEQARSKLVAIDRAKT
jgi:hypothetical protein